MPQRSSRGTGASVYFADPDIKQIAEDNPEFKKDFDNFTGIKYMKYSLNMQMCTLKTLYQEQGNWMAKIIGLLIRFFDKSKYMDNLAEEVFKDRPILLKRVKDKFHNNWEHKNRNYGHCG